MFKKFHVTKPNRTGFMKSADREVTFFQFDDLLENTNQINLRIYTNDYHAHALFYGI
ncbi:hypothetical protein RhiirC2_739621, partial [Rhizophagus irregularis]